MLGIGGFSGFESRLRKFGIRAFTPKRSPLLHVHLLRLAERWAHGTGQHHSPTSASSLNGLCTGLNS